MTTVRNVSSWATFHNDSNQINLDDFDIKESFSVKLLECCWGWLSTGRCYFVISKTFPRVIITKSCTSLKYWWKPKFHINQTQPRYCPARRSRTVGEGEGRRGNTARARCGNVAELSDVGPRTAADRGKWVAVVVAVVVILVGRRIQQFSTPRQSSHILHTLTYSMSPILHSVDSYHPAIHSFITRVRWTSSPQENINNYEC